MGRIGLFGDIAMRLTPADQRKFEAEIAELIRTGKMPSLEQVQTAIETTRQEFQPLILAARSPDSRTNRNRNSLVSPRNHQRQRKSDEERQRSPKQKVALRNVHPRVVLHWAGLPLPNIEGTPALTRGSSI